MEEGEKERLRKYLLLLGCYKLGKLKMHFVISLLYKYNREYLFSFLILQGQFFFSFILFFFFDMIT